MLIDTHAHLDSYTNSEVSEILERARKVGAGSVISAGTTIASSRRSIALSNLFPGFFSGVGIHPMDITEPFTDDTYATLRGMAVENDKVLVMSEIGLDFMEGAPDRALQYPAFREQIRLARELNLPVVFHSRESHDEVFRVLKEERAYEVGGAMHYFQGDERTARTAIDLGFYISLARPLLRLPHLQQVAASIPLESIVLETDAAPQPFKANRESWTEPRHLRDIVERLAGLKDMPVAEVEAAIFENMKKLLKTRWHVVEQTLGVA